MVMKAMQSTILTTAMIMLIIQAAYFLNFVLSSSGVGGHLKDLIVGLNLGPYGSIFIIFGIYLILGCFIETLSLMIIIITIVVLVVTCLGLVPVCFGVIMILYIELV